MGLADPPERAAFSPGKPASPRSEAAFSSAARQLFSRPFLPAWVMLALALSATGFGWRYAERLVEGRARVELDAAASEIQTRITRRLIAYEQVLHAGAALFAASTTVSREEWRQFVAHLRLEEHFPGIQGIGFARRISPPELAAHESALRAEGFSDYALRPPGGRELYTAIVYLEPFSGRNLRAFGYDMFSEPVRRAAMARACHTGDAALSGKVTLVQETARDPQAGFLLYVPVFAAARAERSSEPCAALSGWAFAPFRMTDFILALVGNAAPIVDFEIFDGETTDAAALLFDLGGAAGHETPGHTLWQRQDRMPMAGQVWTIVFRPQPNFLAGLDPAPRLVLASGSSIALLLFLIAAGLTSARLRAEAQAAERAQALAQIEHQNLRLAEAARMKTEFLNTMTHELKTPLNAIIGFADLLASGIPQPLPPEQRVHAQDILDAGRQLLALLSDILAYSRLDAGELKLEPAPVDLAAFLPPRLAALRARAQAKEQTFSIDFDPSAAGIVLVDRDKLLQIVRQLVDNAIKFTPSGGAVALHVRRQGRWLEIAVIDNGIGIAAADQPRLFLPFVQLEGGLARSAGGVGLGLALARRLAQLHDGDILAQSTTGQGSTFTLRLPWREGGKAMSPT